MSQPAEAADAGLSRTAPGDATATERAWPAWYGPLVALGLVGTLVVSSGAFLLSSSSVPPIGPALVYLVLPAAIVASIVLSRRYGPAFALLAAALLDIEALLVPSRAAAGLAYAVIFPIAGLVLVATTVSGRTLWATFVAAGVASTAGIAVGLTVGPISALPGLTSVWLAVVASGVFITFALAHLALINHRGTRAIAAARAEVASRRTAEAELDRTSTLLAAIVNASPVPTQAFTTDGTVMLWNAAAERVFGWSSAELIGARRPPEMTPDDERAAGADRIGRALEGEVVNGERARRRARDGREVWVDIYAARLVDAEGRTIGVAGQLVDVTERVALEAQLRQAAKMEAIGQLSGGIAHDFNNMLTAIRGYAELVGSGLAPDQGPLRDDVDEIVRAADRAGDLTRQLLAFARKAVLEPRVLDPAAVVGQFAPMLRRLLGEHVTLVLELAPDTGRVRVDPVQLEQVILNLAVNARDAMPGGGTLRIATRRQGAGAATRVVLAVSDTGCGMDERTRARIFEPFFTTKEPGKGTGMGLATVFGIVSMFDGTIDVTSEPGRGTTFTICLPVVDDAADPVAEAPGGVPPGGSETILLVEDEPAVRTFARRSLADLGYTVLESPGGADALAIARGHPGRIDLVLSDVALPGIPGPALVRQLATIRPGARVLMCSGFPADAVAGTDTFDPRTCLAKPFTREGLARAVRSTLDTPA